MTLTTERLKWLHDAATELSATKLKMTMRPDELLVLTSELLANREAQPVQVTDGMALDFHRALTDSDIGKDDLEEIKVGLRAALCNVTAPPAPAVPDALEKMRSIVADPRALPRRKEWISGQQYSYVLLENVEAMVDEACRAAMLAQPVSSGYKLVPVELTDRMIDAFNETPPGALSIEDLWRAMLAAAPEGGNG